MLNNIFRKLKNLNSIIKSIYYQFKQQLIFLIFLKNKKYIYDQTKILKKNGYIHLKTIIPEKIIDDFIKNYEKSSKICSAISVLGLLNLIVIKYSVSWWSTLHQPSSVKLIGETTIHSSMLIPLVIMLFTFLLYRPSFLSPGY